MQSSHHVTPHYSLHTTKNRSFTQRQSPTPQSPHDAAVPNNATVPHQSLHTTPHSYTTLHYTLTLHHTPTLHLTTLPPASTKGTLKLACRVSSCSIIQAFNKSSFALLISQLKRSVRAEVYVVLSY